MSASRVITEWDDRALAVWREFPENARAALRNAVRASALYLAGYTVVGYLLNKGPRYLNRRTGTLIRSVTASPKMLREGKDVFAATYGSNLSYAYKHEFGGTFTEAVKGHTRRLREISTGRARELRRVVMAEKLEARRIGQARFLVNRKKERLIAYVRPHKRTRTYRERRMFRDALDARDYVPKGMALRALEIVRDQKRVPSTRELVAIMGGGSLPGEFQGE